MQINGIQGQNAGAGQAKAAQAADSVSKNIRNQITALQNQMQELSANKEMGVEEKMKKRQELKQQIMELQNQLRQNRRAMFPWKICWEEAGRKRQPRRRA